VGLTLRRRWHVRTGSIGAANCATQAIYSNSLNSIEHKKPASVDNPTRFEFAK